MNKQSGYNKTSAGTSIQRVQQQNANYGAEFSTETDVQSVKKANAQSQAKKAQASSNFQNPQQ